MRQHRPFFTGVSMKKSVIPVFIPHLGCPYRCVFCDQHKITGRQSVPTGADVAAKIEAYTRGVKRHWEVAFYGGSFTAVDVRLQEELLAPAYAALASGTIGGLRCSTRPDCITPEILRRLQCYGLTTVELGVQSMDDTVLAAAKRGHTAADVETATALLRDFGFTVGHQLMPGLPGEDWASLAETTARVCRLKPDMVRIYPVVVIAGTELADLYGSGDYTPLSVDEGVRRAAYMKEHFLQQGIDCIRTGLQATEELDGTVAVIGGAYAPAMGDMVDSLRYGRQIRFLLEALERPCRVMISYNRRDTSRTRGYKNENVRLVADMGISAVWQEINEVPLHTILVESAAGKWYLRPDTGERPLVAHCLHCSIMGP